VALSAGGKRVVTGSWDGTAILWESATGKKLQTFQGSIPGFVSVALSIEGDQVITGHGNGTAILWETATGKKIHTFWGYGEGITSVALSADGRHAWTASNDGTTRLWDTATGKELCALLSLDDGEDWLVVTPEGFFDGSNGAWKLMAFRETGTLNVVDDDATRKKFYRPGLLGTLYRGEKPKP
jgi:WD40 repeat protein